MEEARDTVWNSLAPVWVLVFLLSLTIGSSAQSQEVEHLAKVRSISLRGTEHPAGWELLQETSGIDHVSGEGPVAASVTQTWQNTAGIKAEITYFSLFEVDRARGFYSNNVSKGWQSLRLPTNDAAAQFGVECYLLRDDVFIAVGGHVGENNFSDFELTRQVATAISGKLDAAGIVKSLPDLRASAELETLVWSGNQDVIVHVSSEGTLEDEQRYYGLHLYSGNRRVYAQATPEGLEDSVTMTIPSEELATLSPGSYRLGAGVEGALGRRFSVYFDVTLLEQEQEDLTLPATQDGILSLRNQHQNDGANALLTLEKIQGRATRSAVAFDLADTNLDGLSQATLVLNIDSSEGVNGWGNGRTISVQAITMPWLEGNGMNFGLKKKDQYPGSGPGTTWFSPVDEDISNDSSNSAVNWNGAGVATDPPTAPAVTIANGLSGEVSFDVTADVLNGADNGWLILKDQENVGSKISFYSREGAATAGDPDLAPRLLLDFGDPLASTAPVSSLLARIGFSTKLRTSSSGSELRSVKEVLQESPVAALAAEQLITEATRSNLCLV